MSRYTRTKENARQKAMDWQADYYNNSYYLTEAEYEATLQEVNGIK